MLRYLSLGDWLPGDWLRGVVIVVVAVVVVTVAAVVTDGVADRPKILKWHLKFSSLGLSDGVRERMKLDVVECCCCCS